MGKAGAVKVLAMLLGLAGGAAAETRDTSAADTKNPVIQVTGTGSVQIRPDTATIRIGVTTENANAQEAVSANTEATTKVLSELQAASIDKKDLRTSNFSVYPQYRTEGESKRQVLIYRVSNTVTVTVRDIAKVGDILAKVVAAGSNQINGPVFSVSNPEKYLNEARKKAVENAMAKAAAYASAAGLKLGPIQEMSEPGLSIPAFGARSTGLTRSAAPAVPIEAGEDNLEAQILLVIELAKQ